MADHENSGGSSRRGGKSQKFNQPKKPGMPLSLIGVFVLGLVLIVAPMMIQGAGFVNGVVLSGIGAVMAIGSAALIIFTRLYRKATAHEAFVVTGGRGQKGENGKKGARVIIDGGMVVLPFIHEVTPVNLSTMRLDVEREGQDALITGDKLRADVIAEFYIKCKKEIDSVRQAATSLGERSHDPNAIKELVFQKLVNGLRDVAATRPLSELNANRSEFAAAVQTSVTADLEANGLHLETVTISSLDQTPLERMNPDQNVFDAEGAKTIAEITQKNRIARNEAETAADKQVERQNVERDEELAKLDVQRAEAQAKAKSDAEQAEARAKAEADSVRSDEERKAGVAEKLKNEGIFVAEVKAQEAISVANQQKQAAEEIAEQERRISVELKLREHAEAERERLEAEKLRTEEEQAIQTVVVTETAEREKAQVVIAERGEIEKEKQRREMEANVAAYEITKKATADQDAAEKRADAVRVAAVAEKDAELARVDAKRASEMVPVEVNERQVVVDAKQVEVIRAELEAKAEFETIARDLQVELERIGMEKEAAVAYANAMGIALSNANLQIWGDGDALEKVTSTFTNYQAHAAGVNGFLSHLGPESSGVMKGTGSVLTAIAEKLGIEIDPSDFASTATKIESNPEEGDTTEHESA